MLKRTSKNLRGAITLFGLTVNTIVWFVPIIVFAVLKRTAPVRSFRRVMTRWIMAMGENWVSVNAMILGMKAPNRLDVRGIGKLDRNGWYLVIANHQSWVDIIVLQTVFNRRIPFLKFFLKQELIWFPILGIAWWAMDYPFMKRYPKSYLAKHPAKMGSDFEATRIACEKFRETPTSVINFVEGTRFTREKKLRRNSRFEHLLPPRPGGLALALTSIGGMFDALLDVTIVYPQRVTHFWGLCCGELDRVIIDVAARPVEAWMVEGDYGADRGFRGRFHRWLTRIWREKDGRIRSLRGESQAA